VTESRAPTPEAQPPTEARGCSGCSRRTFLARAAALAPGAWLGALATATGCGGNAGDPGGAATEPPAGGALPPGVTRDGPALRVRVAQVPALAQVGGALLVPTARVLVTRPGDADYRAFDAACPHAGSLVANREARCSSAPRTARRSTSPGRWCAGPPSAP
jgi:hypothetical protein